MMNKNNKKRYIIAIVSCLLAVAVVAGAVLFSLSGSKVSQEISVSKAQELVDTTFDALPKPTAPSESSLSAS